jgi:O-antigen biosynthesis protein
MPACSVIVPTLGRPQLAPCLDSLAALDHPDYEVVVVDNTGGDAETRRLAEAAGARYACEPRRGASRARNAGARVAAGEIVAFIDDDAVADRQWLSEHVRALADPTLTATTGRILAHPELDLDPASARAFDIGERAFRVSANDSHWFEIANFGALGYVSNLACRRAVFDAGVRFRESLGLGARMSGGEEDYFFFSVLRAGYEMAYVPAAIVEHDNRRHVSSDPSDEFARARNFAAYLTMMLVEEPDFRGRILRHLVDLVRGRQAPWRQRSSSGGRKNRLRWALAAPGGVALYARSRLAES